MKKYIEIEMGVLERLVDGKCVEGSLRKKLPWGWVKESMQRIKVFGSFPKDVGTAQVMGLLQDHTRDAKNALIERELIEFC